MSFSSEVKEELSHLSDKDTHCMIAELSAIICFGGRIRQDSDGDFSIALHTENPVAAHRFCSLVTQVFQYPEEELMSCEDLAGKVRPETVCVKDASKALHILKVTGLLDNLGQLNMDYELSGSAVLKRTCCRRAFLRGAFLSSGSVTDPEKNYHFEITGSSEALVAQLKDFLRFFGLDAKIVLRKKYYVVYLKEGTMISDVLTIMGANVSMMKFENVRIVKDVRNTVNRRVNCETANINKTVSAARKQIEDIEYIQNTVGLDKLPHNLRDIAALRLEEPDATLKELGEMSEPPVGKSGVNHRLRKLSQIAQNIRENGRI